MREIPEAVAKLIRLMLEIDRSAEKAEQITER